MEPIRRLNTYVETARELNCSERHVRELLTQGKLTALRFGRRVMITGESLQAYLDSSQRVVPKAASPANGKRPALRPELRRTS